MLLIDLKLLYYLTNLIWLTLKERNSAEINNPFKPSIKLQPLIKINKQNAKRKLQRFYSLRLYQIIQFLILI